MRHLVYTVRYSSVPKKFSLLTITSYSPVIKSRAYNDTDYSLINFITEFVCVYISAPERTWHMHVFHTNASVSHVKAVPLQAWTGPQRSRKLRPPDFLTSAHEGGRLSALCTGRVYPRINLVLIFRGWVDMELSDATEKTPATPGIDPGTFRLVAQCLNHYATSGPRFKYINKALAHFVIYTCYNLNLTYLNETCLTLNIRKGKIHKTIKVMVFWNATACILMTFSEVLEKIEVQIFRVEL
jgi:hypothetical protein